MTMAQSTCPACRVGTVEFAITCRTVIYRSVRLKLAPLVLPECGACKELLLNDEQDKIYSEAIDLAYRLEMSRRPGGNDDVIPANPVTALASVRVDTMGAMKRWQAYNRISRDTRGPSKFIFWTHKLGLGFNTETAEHSAKTRDVEGYVAGVFGIFLFPILGLPVNCVRAVRRAFSYVYYGE